MSPNSHQHFQNDHCDFGMGHKNAQKGVEAVCLATDKHEGISLWSPVAARWVADPVQL